MATQRDRFAVQFGVSDTFLPEEGILAATLDLQAKTETDLVALLVESHNLFLRKVGISARNLQNGNLPPALEKEKHTCQWVLEQLARIGKTYPLLERWDMEAMRNAPANWQPLLEIGNKAIYSQYRADMAGYVQTQENRIVEINLHNLKAENSAFLDKFARTRGKSKSTTEDGVLPALIVGRKYNVPEGVYNLVENAVFDYSGTTSWAIAYKGESYKGETSITSWTGVARRIRLLEGAFSGKADIDQGQINHPEVNKVACGGTKPLRKAGVTVIT